MCFYNNSGSMLSLGRERFIRQLDVIIHSLICTSTVVLQWSLCLLYSGKLLLVQNFAELLATALEEIFVV
jgi:hypothetical protein